VSLNDDAFYKESVLCHLHVNMRVLRTPLRSSILSGHRSITMLSVSVVQCTLLVLLLLVLGLLGAFNKMYS